MITDNQSLVSAKSRFGSAIQTYDDGFGPLWIHRDTMGVTGIVRAQTWSDAYSIFEDEFFPAGDEDASRDFPTAYDELSAHEQACFDASYGYRGSGRRMPNGTVSYLYAKDLNGESLDLLTPELLAQLEITLEIQNNG